MALTASPMLLDRVPFWLIAAINFGANFLFGALYCLLIARWRVEPEERELLSRLNKPHHHREVIGHFLKKYLSQLPQAATPGENPPSFPPRT